jgi:cyclopropane fatty-acyl-phospholipid synthase-like methyltransferase
MIISIIWIVFLVAFLISTVVIFVGAPYVPTLRARRRQALDLLDLRQGQVLYDLGSGDGSLLAEAAARGLKAVGYELNPLLVALSWLKTRRYRGQVKIKWGNFWKADLAAADGIFVFLIDRFMDDLEAKVKREAKPGLKLVSHAFTMPGRKPAATENALFLYIYK